MSQSQQLLKNLTAMEESFWLEPELRARYRHELLILMDQYGKLQEPFAPDNPMVKHLLGHISMMADRLIELSTDITPEQCRTGVLRLELSQYPAASQLKESVDWYQSRGVKAMSGPEVKLDEDESRHVLYSPSDQTYEDRQIKKRQWLYSPYRLLGRVVEMFRGM